MKLSLCWFAMVAAAQICYASDSEVDRQTLVDRPSDSLSDDTSFHVGIGPADWASGYCQVEANLYGFQARSTNARTANQQVSSCPGRCNRQQIPQVDNTRNTQFTNGTNNFDVSLFKSFMFRERRRLELRWEAQNAFNHPQFVQVPQRDVVNTLPGRFLNRDFTDGGIRSIWLQVKILF
jgi:hypothetical protein